MSCCAVTKKGSICSFQAVKYIDNNGFCKKHLNTDILQLSQCCQITNGGTRCKFAGKQIHDMRSYCTRHFNKLSLTFVDIDIFENCSICYKVLCTSSMIKTKCDHVFHEKCIRLWLKKSEEDTCPLCRQPTNVLKGDGKQSIASQFVTRNICVY